MEINHWTLGVGCSTLSVQYWALDINSHGELIFLEFNFQFNFQLRISKSNF